MKYGVFVERAVASTTLNQAEKHRQTICKQNTNSAAYFGGI